MRHCHSSRVLWSSAVGSALGSRSAVMSSHALDWKAIEWKPVRFNAIGFDPTLPTKIRRDKFEIGCGWDETALGILASPAADTARVLIILGEYQRSCPSRELARQSQYFRRHLTRFPSPRKLFIPPTIPIDGLDAALHFMETSGVDVTIWNASPILCAASRLGIPDLQRRLEQYLKAVSKINSSYFLQCWEICRNAPASVQTRDEMMRRAAENFARLPEEPEWNLINSQLVRRLLLRPEVRKMSPVSIYEAALAWIAGNPSAERPHVDRVMAAVPFKRMTQIDRMQCLAKAAQMQLTSIILPRIRQASWYQTCIEFNHPSQSDLPITIRSGTMLSDESMPAFKLKPERSASVGSAATEVEFALLSFDGSPAKDSASSAGEDAVWNGGVEAELKSGQTSPPIKLPIPVTQEESAAGKPLLFRRVIEAKKTLANGRQCVYVDDLVIYGS